MYQGTLIKESIKNDELIDHLEILSVDIWRADNHLKTQPLFWTAIKFKSNHKDFLTDLSKQLKPYWYVDLSNDIEKVLVFKNKIIRYTMGDISGRNEAKVYCRQIGIPESQIDWNEV